MVLIMSGSIPLLPLSTVMGCIGTLLPFTFIVYYRLKRKELMVFMEKKKTVYSENRMGHEYRCFKCYGRWCLL
jgi:hypothetical protein